MRRHAWFGRTKRFLEKRKYESQDKYFPRTVLFRKSASVPSYLRMNQIGRQRNILASRLGFVRSLKTFLYFRNRNTDIDVYNMFLFLAKSYPGKPLKYLELILEK